MYDFLPVLIFRFFFFDGHKVKVWFSYRIIIKALWQHGFLWIYLIIRHYWSLLLVSPLERIQCPHRADECKFLLVNKHSCIFIIKSFQTIVFIFIVISTTFQPIYPPAFFGNLHGVSMSRSPLKNTVYALVLTSLAMPVTSSCLIWMVCNMGGKWLYSCCFVGCYFQDLFKAACSILV